MTIFPNCFMWGKFLHDALVVLAYIGGGVVVLGSLGIAIGGGAAVLERRAPKVFAIIGWSMKSLLVLVILALFGSGLILWLSHYVC